MKPGKVKRWTKAMFQNISLSEVYPCSFLKVLSKRMLRRSG